MNRGMQARNTHGRLPTLVMVAQFKEVSIQVLSYMQRMKNYQNFSFNCVIFVVKNNYGDLIHAC